MITILALFAVWAIFGMIGFCLIEFDSPREVITINDAVDMSFGLLIGVLGGFILFIFGLQRKYGYKVLWRRK